MATSDSTTKVCHKCKVEKPVTEFVKDKSRHDGYCHWCKACRKSKYDPVAKSIYNKAHYQEQREQRLVAAAKYREENREKHNACSYNWWMNNKQKRLAQEHTRYQLKREYILKQKADYRANNRDKLIIGQIARRARVVHAEGTHTTSDLKQILTAQEGLCAYCGIRLIPELRGDTHVDHIQPLSRGGSNWPDNLALTCSTCNLSKHDKLLSEWNPCYG